MHNFALADELKKRDVDDDGDVFLQEGLSDNDNDRRQAGGAREQGFVAPDQINAGAGRAGRGVALAAGKAQREELKQHWLEFVQKRRQRSRFHHLSSSTESS